MKDFFLLSQSKYSILQRSKFARFDRVVEKYDQDGD